MTKRWMLRELRRRCGAAKGGGGVGGYLGKGVGKVSSGNFDRRQVSATISVAVWRYWGSMFVSEAFTGLMVKLLRRCPADDIINQKLTDVAENRHQAMQDAAVRCLKSQWDVERKVLLLAGTLRSMLVCFDYMVRS